MKITEKQIRSMVHTANMGVMKATPYGLKVHRLDTGYTLETITRDKGQRHQLLDHEMSASECMSALTGYMAGVEAVLLSTIPLEELKALVDEARRAAGIITNEYPEDEWPDYRVPQLNEAITAAKRWLR